MMKIFNEEFEGLWFRNNKDAGLKMAIAIHDRTLGSALGGIRIFPYTSEEAMITDVLRLAKGMTYKNAIIYRLSEGYLSHGGGKSVICANPRIDKTEKLLLAAADAIEELNGAYIGGEDMGMKVRDIEVMLRRTRFLVGKQETHHWGGNRGSGDPSPMTALGTFEGLRSCLSYVFGTDRLWERTIAIQGVGNVGKPLLNYLVTMGRSSNIVITDIYEEEIAEAKRAHPGIRTIPPEEEDRIYDEECDIFMPCAIGGIINDKTLPRLKCKIVAGCANNQLLKPSHGEKLWRRGILYAPDYVINAGGAINVALEDKPGGHDHSRATKIIKEIRPLLSRIFTEAKGRNVPPELVADEFAERVIRNARNAKNNF